MLSFPWTDLRTLTLSLHTPPRSALVVMAGGNTAKSSKKGQQKSRPSSTSQLATPLDSSKSVSPNVLSSFSPFNDWFACVTQSIDRDRLQIYSCDEQSRVLADYIIPNAKCGCLQWLSLPSSSSASQQQSAKKRRKRQSLENIEAEVTDEETLSPPAQIVLALGLSTGSIHLFNPLQGKVVRVLSKAVTSTSSSASNATLSLAFSSEFDTLFACLQDGSLSSWALKEVAAHSEATPIAPSDKYPSLLDSTTPFRQVTVLSTDRIAIAHHSIAIYSLSTRDVVATYTGHASNVTHLVPLLSSARFVSAAEGDRVVNVWLSPQEGRKTARPFATLPLDAPVSHLDVLTDNMGKEVLVVVTAKGSVRLYGVPSDLDNPSSKAKKSGGIPTLPLLTDVSLVAKEGDREELPALNAQLAGHGQLRVARVIKGAKVLVEAASTRDDSGTYKTKLVVVRGKSAGEGAMSEHLGGSAATQRYSEAGTSAWQRNSKNASVTGANGLLTGPDDVGALNDDQANLDASIEDLEEPSLGQRLKGLRMGAGVNGVAEEEEDDDEGRAPAAIPMGSLSLGQTLTQALHSNDAALLSSCLAHSDPAVIRSSVSRLSGPLAVKLLEHCVDRMGRGGKKSTGSLGSARTRGMIEWVRATLIAHTGYLMSLPNLVHRLSALHSTLSSRLASHERLLALNGRLELVLGQIEMRATYALDHGTKVQGVKTRSRQDSQHGAKKKQDEGRHWVESSSDEDEQRGMEVDGSDDDDARGGLDDVVRGEEEGEVQDIAHGHDTLANTSADSDEEADEEDEEMDEDDDGDDDGEESGEEASDESALDEEGDSEDVDEEDEEDSDDDVNRGGLLDMEAESTDGDEESDASEE